MTPNRQKNNEQGIALVFVVFMVSLASILAVNMARSTYLNAQATGLVQRQLQSEYLLKSLVSFAAGLIKEDSSSNIDAEDDPWGLFASGLEVPSEYLNIKDQSIRSFLEIRPMNAAFRIDANLGKSEGSDALFKKKRDILYELLQLALPEDLYEQPDHLKLFQQTFTVEDMIANLIDYLDVDETPYQDDNFSGIESSDDKLAGIVFKNSGEISSMKELAQIPGFTPARMQYLSPLLTTEGDNNININLASTTLIQALHQDIDESFAREIYDYIRSEEGPLKSYMDLGNIPGFPQSIDLGEYRSILTTGSRKFQVIGKVEAGLQQTQYIRARIDKGSDRRQAWPAISKLELF